MRFIVDVLRRILGKPYRLETLPPKVLKRVLGTQYFDNFGKLQSFDVLYRTWSDHIHNAQKRLKDVGDLCIEDYEILLMAIDMPEEWHYDFIMTERIGDEIARVRQLVRAGDTEPAKAFLRSKYRMKLRWRYNQILD